MTTSAFCIASLVVMGGNRVKQFREAENSIRFNSTATNSKFELHSLIYHDLYAAVHSRCMIGANNDSSLLVDNTLGQLSRVLCG